MPKELHIASNLSLPIDAATQTFAFIARKGAGKTYAAGKLAECFLDVGVQVVILDSVGNWYGLRLLADGKTPGYDIPVIGGLRGDIPLEATGGHLIADIVTETGRSVIVDISQFNKSDRQRFATAFAEQLWKSKKAERHPSPVHLIIEESQLIIPETVRGDVAKMVGIYEEIIRLGRNYGIGVSMITQRPQSVNKEVLNQTECLFALQVNGKHERIALRDWMTYRGAEKTLVDELPSLPVGSAYVWSPQWLGILRKVKIGQKKTFDASATPKVGSYQVRRELKPLNLDDLKARMAATIEKAKASDPKELNAIIAGLRRDLTAAQKSAQPREQDTLRIKELTEQLAQAKAATKTEPPKIIEKRIMAVQAINRLDTTLKRAEAFVKSARGLSVRYGRRLVKERSSMRRSLNPQRLLPPRHLRHHQEHVLNILTRPLADSPRQLIDWWQRTGISSCQRNSKRSSTPWRGMNPSVLLNPQPSRSAPSL